MKQIFTLPIFGLVVLVLAFAGVPAVAGSADGLQVAQSQARQSTPQQTEYFECQNVQRCEPRVICRHYPGFGDVWRCSRTSECSTVRECTQVGTPPRGYQQ